MNPDPTRGRPANGSNGPVAARARLGPLERRDLRAALVLALVCLLIYNANFRVIASGDSYPTRFLPFGIWRYATLRLDPIAHAVARDNATPYWIVKGRGGRQVSLYPVVLPVLIAPLYLPAVAYMKWRGWTDERLDRVAAAMEKLTASLIAAAAVALLFLLLRKRAPFRDALLLSAAFAFGTNTWVVGSQALWQHGLAELLLVAALWLLTGAGGSGRSFAAGLLCGLIAANRPPDAVLSAALGLYGLQWSKNRKNRTMLISGAALPIALVAVYNLWATGHIVGGYAVAGRPVFSLFFGHSLSTGVAGLLVSPTRGLFVFCPFLLFLVVGLRKEGAESVRRLAIALGAASLVQLLVYAKTDWRGGCSWGPRFLTDMLPFLVWMLVPALAALSRPGRKAFVAAVALSIAVQAVGAFWYTDWSDIAIYQMGSGPDAMQPAWDPSNTPFVLELRHAPAAMSLLPYRFRRNKTAHEFALQGLNLVSLTRSAIARTSSSASFAGIHLSLQEAARRAAARIQEDQEPEGFWPTIRTVGPRWEGRETEVDMCMTAILVDLFEPLTSMAGLGEAVDRARGELARQIEPTGLVRYFGRPQQTIPDVGCTAITPDADDTSLVWSAALPKADPKLLAPALETLRKYRTPEGLYGTWLAPQSQFQCLLSGKLHDPLDAGTQVHVYVMLAKTDPAAAAQLCSALEGRISDDRMRVYYRLAPLDLVLRQSELRRGGCALRLPKEWLRKSLAGQEPWLAAAWMIDQLDAPTNRRPPRAEVNGLLEALARDDFAAVRRTPPLVYHDDVAAPVPPFYWSEDFGYGLWLRLYQESLREYGS